ncbi:MAG: hypothetical protein JF613_08835, partial [Acidobacteria bacterium]|nr:hypothetical protein [Acidobacteriota bacterium]
MLRTVVEARTLVAMMVAAGVGTWGLRTHPVDQENLFLALIAARDPVVFHVLTYGYATMWFSTSFFAASVVLSSLAIVAYRHAPSVRSRALPLYPVPERRPAPSVVLGEAHSLNTPGRAHSPDWLVIPERGLYTGIAILGAVGTGKTSACMYPYVDQLLRWRADDPKRKIGGLIMEVKGDFCRQVRTMLVKAGREQDYLEIGLNTGYCYNPLHNDLDPYAVAYAIASLFNNLFGKPSEPFWQQAYTDLLKFVISLRRVSDGYTTLSEVYRYIINEGDIDKNIRALNAQFKQPPDVIAVSRQDYEYELRDAPWTLWAPLDGTTVAHPYDAALESHLVERAIYFSVRTGPAALSADRRHRLEAIDRWFYSTWVPLDRKVKASIVEGVVVLLSLFDENPDVYRAFCPSREVYAKTPA